MDKLTFLAFCLILATVIPMQGQEDAQAIIDKAVKAVGGAEELGKFKAVRAKLDGTGALGKDNVPCTIESWFQYPSQLKTDLQCDFRGRKFILIQVINGDKAWRSENGQTQEAKGHTFTELQEGLYFQRLETLVPLVTDKGYGLSTLGEIKVNDRAAVGVKVVSQGHRDLNLYFDKETDLLVKSEHWLPDLTGKEVFRETIFSDFDSHKQWRKMAVYQDSKKVLDAKVIEVKFLNKIDAKEFDKP